MQRRLLSTAPATCGTVHCSVGEIVLSEGGAHSWEAFMVTIQIGRATSKQVGYLSRRHQVTTIAVMAVSEQTTYCSTPSIVRRTNFGAGAQEGRTNEKGGTWRQFSGYKRATT